ncbi:S8 family serine peptidase [Blastococcus sp. PRF04-17]|uniref:S8 family serine peptidase n=1 Tax=Blastococcus sp. PRF04-17 TaxID=2933797 RepID=UPI001FF59528|nr:S8 family serine peptidase [Blastococcus sp. PRF04-17]UOY03282.1 S8 family serine peptidase [Blastococcus sp. PRF04-17]
MATLGALLAGSGLSAAHADVQPALGYDPVTNKGALYNIAEVVGAHDAYRKGLTGKGVGVALIDTGIAPVPGLTSGNVVNGPDLSFDSQLDGMAHLDAFGHGTHMGSIIAGRDAAGTPSSYLDPGRFTGIAPDATLVNVKVGAHNGAVDVTQVIAGINWVVEHAKDPGLNIRVISLAYGTDSLQSSTVDPLAYAVENAWKRGIVVVAAGGNDGRPDKTLANPAYDPHVLAVGAMDSAGTVDSSDDTVPSWSTRGTTARHVDVVAPGVSVLGLRVPGGVSDSDNPQARVGDRFARASGTSQATAVVAGQAALILQQYPWLAPDQVKQLMMTTASGILSTVPIFGGSGMVNLRAVLNNPIDSLLKTVGGLLDGVLNLRWSSGTGSLEKARGSFHVGSGTSELRGEIDIFGRAWSAYTWARDTSYGTVWNYGDWRGVRVAGNAWRDGAWPTVTWPGADWTGASWTADGWSAKTWSGDSWSAKTWSGDTWSAKTWSGDTWSAKTWSGHGWD